MPVAPTILDALVARVRKAGEHNKTAEVPPVVILWPDRARQWEPMLPALLAAMPELLVLGTYAPDRRTGPAIWIRCALARTVPALPASGNVPVLYLPGVSRDELRAVESCPPSLRPLAELQYRGCFFGVDGKDWTVPAFFSSKKGLGLDLADDLPTHTALRQVLARLAALPADALGDRRLEASDFHELLSPDFDRDLLRWMNSPAEVKGVFTPAEWSGLRDRCVKRYSFDPDQDGTSVAAERLSKREGAWATVWTRFEENPTAYPALPGLLEGVGGLFQDPVTSPAQSRKAEDALRAALLDLASQSPTEAASRVVELETKHAPRRKTVWARLGKAPLARALEPLALLATAVGDGVGGGTPNQVAARYRDGGWRADDAVIRALAAVEGKDADAVHAAITALYRPWLDAAAEALFLAVQDHGYPRPEPLPALAEGECALFADGLRYDLGKRLAEALTAKGLALTEGWRWVAFPPVTPTAKPAISPIAGKLAKTALNDDFRPDVAESGRPLTPDLFKRLLNDLGVQVLTSTETGDPTGRGWTEFGDIDTYGHQHGWKTAGHVEGQIRELTSRVTELLDAGWSKVRVVTDHGWLLLPRGLPKRDLHASLTSSRWRRCATLKAGVVPELPTIPWHWGPDVPIVPAPGIGIFVDGTDYSHGGLTLQECVAPLLVVEASKRKVSVTIDALKWVGMRCKVTVKPALPGLKVDVRTRAADPNASVAETGSKALDTGGVASIPVKESAEGQAVVVVVIDESGAVVARRQETVGGEG